MSELSYGVARKIVEDLVELYKANQPRPECDEIHMMALYLLGTFKEAELSETWCRNK